MKRAQAMLSAREALQRLRPSQPQISVGAQVRALAEQRVRDWWTR